MAYHNTTAFVDLGIQFRQVCRAMLVHLCGSVLLNFLLLMCSMCMQQYGVYFHVLWSETGKVLGSTAVGWKDASHNFTVAVFAQLRINEEELNTGRDELHMFSPHTPYAKRRRSEIAVRIVPLLDHLEREKSLGKLRSRGSFGKGLEDTADLECFVR